MTDKRDPQLDDAYALETPEDSRRLYADWAESYDTGFMAQQDYQLPRHVAEAFATAGGTGPVLDIGAGTGACGAHLARLGIGPLHGTDIAREMLDMAARKNIYERLFTGDVTTRLDSEDNAYGGIVSSGTFTTGHVGPDAIDELLRLARPDALIAISINKAHFKAAGFEDKLASLGAKIRNLRLPEVRIYGANATGEHRDDMALIALFEVN